MAKKPQALEHMRRIIDNEMPAVIENARLQSEPVI